MAKAQTQTGSKALRAVFADAQRKAEESSEVFDPDPHQARDGVMPGRWAGAPFDNMPADCPVKVVGRDAAGAVYCISTTGHMRKMERWDMPALTDLFTPKLNSLFYYWPGWSKNKKRKTTDPDTGEEIELPLIDRVERDKCMMAIVKEASRKPDFDPNTQHRGRGGWQDSQNNFIWHSGGWLWTSDGKKLERARPMQHDGFLYTRMATTIEPWAEPVTAEESPARRILEDMLSWKWQRPYLDPILCLGWLATALMGGALKARPIVFTTGGAGVGKSTLHELIRSVLAGAVTTSVNTTAAGIYQRAKLDSLPFMIDELESKSGSSRAEAVIELARVSYTGGDISRGGQDHEATTFTARNSFFFSAINAPPMGVQDKTRMALLNLGRLDAKDGIGRKVLVAPETDGRMILRQVMDGWHRFQGELQQYYWEELRAQGLDSRAIDTFGTLLAAAELLVGREALEDAGLPAGEANRVGEIVAAATAVERSENLDNWHACLDRLLQSPIDAWREGIKPTVGSVCELFRTGEYDAQGARERLELVGLGVIDKKVQGKDGRYDAFGPLLAIPAHGPMLMRIFADTDWHKGVWFSALKQAPRQIVISTLGNGQKVKINGSTLHCLLVDLEAFDQFASKVE